MDQKLFSEEFCNDLDEQTRMLNRLYKEKQKSILNAPEGHLRVSFQGKNKIPRFYHVKGKYSNGEYLDESHSDDIRRLAQKDYDQKLLSELDKVHKSLNALNEKILAVKLDEVFENLPEGRKNVTIPFRMSMDNLVSQWMGKIYEGKAFDSGAPQIFTSTGIRVRSKSEVIIADTLSFLKIPFRYEYPLKIKGMGTIYPDFFCLNSRTGKEIIWEHFGMMGQETYSIKTAWKINHYMAAGYFLGENLIFSMETEQQPLNSAIVRKIAEHYLL